MAVELRIPARALERRVLQDEDRTDWGRVYQLSSRIDLATRAERPDISHAAAGELVSLAARRLRRIGGSDAA